MLSPDCALGTEIRNSLSSSSSFSNPILDTTVTPSRDGRHTVSKVLSIPVLPPRGRPRAEVPIALTSIHQSLPLTSPSPPRTTCCPSTAMRGSPHAPSSEYLIAENTTRISDDYIQVSLRVAMSNPGDDHFSFGCFSRTPRPNTPSGAGNTQRQRRFPGPFFSTNNHQDQTRNEYGVPPGYGQQGWSINPQATYQQQTQYPPNDPRYPAQFAPYPGRPSSSMLPEQHDSRTLPPLNMQPGQHHPGASSAFMPGSSVRSPIAGYPSGYAPYAEGHQPPSHGSFYAPQAPDPRNLPPPISSNIGYDTSMMPRRSSMSVDRTASTRLSIHGTSPYPRNPPMGGPVSYTPEPPVQEPAIKKKRKRADAEQLKVLNETYNRTAFPSTEERAELAKRLNMSARSVQIWFQNKRQAMRQSSRQAAAAGAPTTSEPYPTSSHVPSGPSPGPYGAHPAVQPHGGRPGELPHPVARLIPSPTPSMHHREDQKDPRRYSGRGPM
ncbi:homeobox-domain-containing protein [Daedalea quercina L-15889]|uniref:Homeobox-domain-containing protein n=1 Tax=Daedalea quercina L-15889 TaxID=1314783 RepID=A0A165RNA3_9APHY|nr:homeobox-domain-containing protein [Daedalea quercina L-15889]